MQNLHLEPKECLRKQMKVNDFNEAENYSIWLFQYEMSK